MKIAVTSQNRKTVTEHAGRCRKFFLYDIEQGAVTQKTLLDLPAEQSLHDSAPHAPHPLDGVTVLITGGAGPGLVQRLAMKGTEVLVTTPEIEPDQAVNAYLSGTLAVLSHAPTQQARGEFGQGHGQGGHHGHHCGCHHGMHAR